MHTKYRVGVLTLIELKRIFLKYFFTRFKTVYKIQSVLLGTQFGSQPTTKSLASTDIFGLAIAYYPRLHYSFLE